MDQLIFYNTRVTAGSSIEELIEALSKVTDSDYNGENGEDYYYKCETMSDLEYTVRELYGTHTIPEIIKAVIEGNFKDNTYYLNYNYCIEDIPGDDYLVVVAAISQ